MGQGEVACILNCTYNPRYSLHLATFSSKILHLSSTCYSGWLTIYSSSWRGLHPPEVGADIIPGINIPWGASVQLHDVYLQLSWATEAQDQIALASPLRTPTWPMKGWSSRRVGPTARSQPHTVPSQFGCWTLLYGRGEDGTLVLLVNFCL